MTRRTSSGQIRIGYSVDRAAMTYVARRRCAQMGAWLSDVMYQGGQWWMRYKASSGQETVEALGQ